MRAALNDPDKFAAAHFILTRLWEDSSPFSAADWNGLRVMLTADHRTIIYEEQIPELRRHWDTKFE
ncbi:MAG TPA: hypothetical protein VG125_15960 [Pirellulales bacterium]|nr:hypothetical protein [Pirellulales bacterium]